MRIIQTPGLLVFVQYSVVLRNGLIIWHGDLNDADLLKHKKENCNLQCRVKI